MDSSTASPSSSWSPSGSPQGKRFKREVPSRAKQGAAPDPADLNAIAESTALLSRALLKEAQSVWQKAKKRQADHADGNEAVTAHSLDSESSASLVPDFKVGTLEMYRRFPEAYDAFMRRHNCTAIEAYLLDEVLQRIVQSALPISSSSSPDPSVRTGANQLSTAQASASNPDDGAAHPFVRVADFGCGTGRIEEIVVRHPATQAVYGYDSEVAMLRRCVVNTVRAAAEAGHCPTVTILPVATTASTAASSPAVVIAPPATNEATVSESALASSSSPSSLRALELCFRPCTFQAVQAGFLTATSHPKCQVVVCAWSLSYVMRMQWGENRWHDAVDSVVAALVNCLDTSMSDAAVIVIETLGNGSTEPTRNNTLMQRLEDTHGFVRRWVRTDYEFANTQEATRMVRFFFGEKLASQLQRDSAKTLLECTGIWTFWKPRQTPPA